MKTATYIKTSTEYNGISTEYNELITEYNNISTKYNDITTQYNKKSIIRQFWCSISTDIEQRVFSNKPSRMS